MVRLPFFSKSTEEQNKFLTIDINSSNVKCVAFYKEDSQLKIIGSGAQNLESGSVRAGNIVDLQNTLDATVAAADQATRNLEERLNNAIFGVTGDLCVGLTTTIRSKRKNTEPISKKELQSLYEKIKEATYIQAQNEYLQMMGNSDTELEIITSSTVFANLDKNEADTLEGKSGSLIETAVFSAFTPGYHLEALAELSKKTGLDILAVGSELYAITQFIKLASSDNVDFVVIDVSSDTTNVAVVFGGGIVATKSLNVGRFHFIEGISNKMGLTISEAERMLNAYIGGNLAQSESSIVQGSLEDSLDIWLEGLELLFGEFSGVKTFSSKIFITGEGADLPDLLTLAKEEPWTKGIPFKSPPDFRRINLMDLDKISDSTGRVSASGWIPTACLSIIYEEMEESL
jgi:cell division ATPase FtsA